MTYKEILEIIYPENVSDDYCGGCKGCPGDHIQEGPIVSEACHGIHEESCAKCWNSEAPVNEEKKYIKPEDIKEIVHKLKAEPCPDDDGLFSMSSAFHTIRAKIVEEQDHMIMSAVRHIAGNMYTTITLDKRKVYDALSKAIPKDVVREQVGKHLVKKCPTCGKWLRITDPIHCADDYAYCGRCGQKLDWDISKEGTDDE